MYDVTNSTSTNVGPVVRGRTLAQTFVARDDLLTGVSLWIATYQKQIRSNARLLLLDAASGDVLRAVTAGTAGIGDNTWQRFAFEPVRKSKGRTFELRFETDAERDAITLWTNDRIRNRYRENGVPAGAAICFRSHYERHTHELLDTLTPSWFQATTPPAARELLHDIVRYCVARKGYFFLRLAHLLDALEMTKDVTRVLSIGCGMGYHEAYLAARFPRLRIDATDLTLGEDEFNLPNLRFQQLDIVNPTGGMNYDFVFSIECLEHIEDYRAAFRNMAAKVAPGGYFYLSVPFASRAEQVDEGEKRRAWEVAEHYTPGFDFDTLDAYFAGAGFRVLHRQNMFECGLARPLNALLNVMDVGQIEAGLEDIVPLFLQDLDTARVESSRQAEGVRVLARRGAG